MFSSIKMEEYMESELPGIFRVKLVTKNIEGGSPGTQFMHTRVNIFERDYSNFHNPIPSKDINPVPHGFSKISQFEKLFFFPNYLVN